jgi:mycoredoxin
MKKWIVVFLAVFAFQKWDVIESYLHPLPDYVSEHNVAVVMYVKAECEACDTSRAFMDENNIAYYEYDIEISTSGKQQYDVLKGEGVPLLLANGMTIQGFQPDRILSLAKSSSGLLGRLGL